MTTLPKRNVPVLMPFSLVHQSLLPIANRQRKSALPNNKNNERNKYNGCNNDKIDNIYKGSTNFQNDQRIIDYSCSS